MHPHGVFFLVLANHQPNHRIIIINNEAQYSGFIVNRDLLPFLNVLRNDLHEHRPAVVTLDIQVMPAWCWLGVLRERVGLLTAGIQ